MDDVLVDPASPPEPAPAAGASAGRPGPAAGHPSDSSGWTVVMPLKSSARGKSRIDLAPDLRRRLVLLMATDAVTAVAGAPGVARVLLVVEDADDGRTIADAARATAAPESSAPVDAHVTTATSLNAAIRDGAAQAGEGPVAVLPCDVPSATAAEIGAALAAAHRHERAVVADADGVGTTLLAARHGRDLRPRYGPDSWRRHVDDGATPLELPAGSGLRRDVDLRSDLAMVTGPATRRAWRDSQQGTPAPTPTDPAD